MAKTYKIECEYTDTFGGEPNYCWVRRAELELPVGASERTIMTRIRKALGIQGLRGRWNNYGDAWEFKPYKCCTIAMARVID